MRKMKFGCLCFLAGLIVALGLFLPAAVHAQSTQASGSILVEPDRGQDCIVPVDGSDNILSTGESLDIAISIFNTSKTGGVFTNATVSGTTTNLLSCADDACVLKINALAFDSCTPAAGVASCVVVPDGVASNLVIITYDGGGKALAAQDATLIATIHAHAVPGSQIEPPGTCGPFFARSETGNLDILNPSGNVRGGAQGSAPLFYPIVCGDGEVSTGEFCDDGNSNDNDACRNDCTACGDSIINGGEYCDDGNTNNDDGCRNDCTACGDGVVNDGEFCDDGNSNNDDACRNDCTGCGDGVVNGGEFCDDGNTNNADACRTDCTACGDSIVNGGEFCDDGNSNDADACRNNCTACGDSIVNGGEFCDDGNSNNNDACRNNCTACGDSIVNGGEYCDDGNSNDADACRNNCTACGDSIVNGGEFCDDGNSNDADACRNNCTACGDGIVNGGEYCDDGNSNNTDACRTDCTACGDGIVNGGEECDDGNSNDADTCRNDCTPPQNEEICRTPGFWATHAGAAKAGSTNITKAVITACGGCLEICGDKIDNTRIRNADSALEAMCVSIKGNLKLQLVRQLTAAALNCCITGSGASCGGMSIDEVFNACNDACAEGEVTAEVGGQTVNCIEAIDAFNNGLISNCHDRPLCNEEVGLCFDPPGPAGSSDACNTARTNACKVIGTTGEAGCDNGTDDGEFCD